MNKHCRTGFTLTELVVVIMVLSILASLALPRYLKAIEKARNKEAKSSLSLLSAAEQSTFYETGSYVSCTSTSACNSQLHLSLPSGNWSYSVSSDANGFTAVAQRRGGSRKWTLSFDGENETLSCTGSAKYCE